MISVDKIDTKELGAADFNHCASIAPHKDGVMIAWYAGTRECSEDQSVYITYYKDGEYSYPIRIGDKTGNPVIWAENRDKSTLLYSYFEKMTNNIVQRWMYCSNWIRYINYEGDNKFKLGSKRRFKTDPKVGLLGRCQPIWFKGRWLLPMYREHNCYGEIYEGKGLNFRPIGKIGESNYSTETRFGKGLLIQPTLWHDGKIIYSLSRDITPSRRAWLSISKDEGKTWSKPQASTLTNYNNSLVALHHTDKPSDEPMIVWNHTDSLIHGHRSTRYRLLFGQLKNVAGEMRPVGLLQKGVGSLIKLNDREPAAYPNYCYDYKGDLHIIHTDYPMIKHHVFKVSQPKT